MNREKPKWTDIAVVILTVGIVLAAVVQTVVFNKQWKEMHDSGTDTHDLAVAAKAQADAAKAQADAAKAQADRTKELAHHALAQTTVLKALTNEADRANDIALGAMEANVRAWVSVDVGEKTGNFSVTMKNTGKSPAINVNEVTAFSSGKGGPPEIDLSQNSSSNVLLPKNAPPELLEQLKKGGFIRDRPPSGYVIAPGETQIASDYQGKFTQIFRFDTGRLGTERTYVQGRVAYVDIFGKPRETLFCYWFAPPSDFVMCNDHNKME